MIGLKQITGIKLETLEQVQHDAYEGLPLTGYTDTLRTAAVAANDAFMAWQNGRLDEGAFRTAENALYAAVLAV